MQQRDGGDLIMQQRPHDSELNNKPTTQQSEQLSRS